MKQELLIKKAAHSLGADVCGIARIDRFSDAPEGFHPLDVFGACRSAVVFGRRMPKGLTRVAPRICYMRATDVNLLELDRTALALALQIEDLGGLAVPLPSDSPYEYWDDERKEGRGLISLRHAAVLAGLGSLGKNGLVLNAAHGSLLNFGAVLTDLELVSDPLAEPVCIEGCRRCIDSCPQGALGEGHVDQLLCRAHTYSENARGFAVCNCNTCRTVCPRVGGLAAKAL